MKYIFIIINALLLFSYSGLIEAKQHSPSYSTTNYTASYNTASFQNVPSQLQPIVNQLLKLPEARQLLAQVSQEGPVGIAIDNHASGEFDALWDGIQRVIRLNSNRHPTQGSWICSILFELHNASTNQHMGSLFEAAEANRMTKEQWVQAMERMEHRNARNTCDLLEKGIAQGIYPAEARWDIFYSFDDHYKLQQLSGHSQWLARNYDQTNRLSPRPQSYQGTIPEISRMTAEDKKDFQYYLVMKNAIENPSKQKADQGKAWLKNEYARLESCVHGKRREGCMRTKEKIHLLNLAFKGNSEFEQLSKQTPLF